MKDRKLWISLLCCMCVLLSSCNYFGIKQKEVKPTEDTKVKETEKKEEKSKSKMEGTSKVKDKPEEKVDIKSKVNPDSIRKINVDSVFNKGIYTGFTDKQLQMLNENGFVIMEPSGHFYFKMHQGYEHIAYSDASVMVTTDSVLHMWHVFYSESMKYLELSKYFPNLKELSAKMQSKVLEEAAKAPAGTENAFTNVMAYFEIANHLLANEEAAKVSSPAALEIVKAELANIGQESSANSAMFKRMMEYSQFKVRGHYNTHENLQKYFKAMMWYGFTGFDVQKQPAEALIISKILFDNPELYKLWQENYELTKLYSGESDDVTSEDMKIILSSLGNENIYGHLTDQGKLKKTVDLVMQKLPEPRIIPDLSDENQGFKTDKLFKFMGQRFSVDAYIMQNLMKAIIRPQSTSFDVFAAMGHEASEKVLRENYETTQNWPEYDDVLAKMKKEYQDGELTKGDNLYNGWIRAIDKTLNYVPEGKVIPHFMASPAYEYKKINAALGSFAELKHDNILYSKQAMAEMGGPEEAFTYHYLEPNVDLYQELLDLSNKALKLMAKAGLQEEMEKSLSNIRDTMEAFVRISKKELNGEDLTRDEFMEIVYFGGLVEYLNTAFAYKAMEYGIDMDTVKTTALIADIATILANRNGPGGIVEVATALPMEMYVLCHVNGKDFLAKGYVYTAVEFLSPERISDEEWQQSLGLETKTEEYGSYIDFKQDKYTSIRDYYMSYVKEFSTGEPNNVEVELEVEIKWPKPAN